VNTAIKQELNESTEFGGFWIRVGAYFIDMVVLLIPTLLASFLYTSVVSLEGGAALVAQNMISLLFGWVYFAVCHSSVWQASLGKKAVGLKVVDEDGNRISFGRATGRYFSMLLSGLILGIGYLMIVWSKRNQALHDIIAGTLVVKVGN
jgi:uncharacterized RDD family membrane protein YckC